MRIKRPVMPNADHDLVLFFLAVGWVYNPSVDAYLRYHITHSPDGMSLESDGGMILTGENRRTRRKTCPSATLSTTNPTWTDLGANPGLRGEGPVTNDLSHGTAVTTCYISNQYSDWPQTGWPRLGPRGSLVFSARSREQAVLRATKPPAPEFQGLWGYSGQGVNLTTYIHLE
jgi:hypothetical protein